MLREKNKGAALVNVMLISAFVMVMASTVISIAFSNYRMKLVNLNAKNNFYACESILDELRVDFRNSINDSVKKSDVDKFSELLSKFGLDGVRYNGVPRGEKDPTLYDVGKIARLIKMIGDNPVTDTQWTPIKLNGESCLHAYETTVDGVHVVVSATPDYNNPDDDTVKLYKSKVITQSELQCNLYMSSSSMCFGDITVSYEQNGYMNSISTDIDLKFMGKNSSMFSLDTYSIISFGGWEINDIATGNAGTYVVEGNMYLGSGNANSNALIVEESTGRDDYSLICTGQHIVINGNLVLKNGGRVCFPNAIDVYVNGDILISGEASRNNAGPSELVLGQNAKIYVSNLPNRKVDYDKITVLTGDLETSNDRRKFNKDLDGVKNFSGAIKTFNFDDIIEENKKYTDPVTKKEFEIGTKISDNNFFNNTKMKNAPINQNYALMTNQATLNADSLANKSLSDDKAAIAVMNTSITDPTVLSYRFTGLIISRNKFYITVKIEQSDEFVVAGRKVKSVIFKPLSDRFREIMNIDMQGEKFVFKFSELFKDPDMKIGAVESSESSQESGSGSKQLSITYSNWSRE